MGKHLLIVGVLGLISAVSFAGTEKYKSISGIYPHLSMWNSEGECGTGAVVPWAGKLWAITYGPHVVYESDDRLYEIDKNLDRIIRPESLGGTHANRLVHEASKQLVIGCYFIDEKGNVRAIDRKKMAGRLTGTARSQIPTTKTKSSSRRWRKASTKLTSTPSTRAK